MAEKYSTVPVVGKNYYIESHAYHHYLGRVVAVSARLVTLVDCVRVHYCGRGWGDFFREGLGDDTTCERFPDGSSVPYDLGFFPWGDRPTLPRGMK